jgi:hypothetical protein
MELLWTDTSQVIPDLMQHMGLYFAQFRPYRSGGTLYGAVARTLRQKGRTDRLLLATLNYECVLEVALAQHGFGIEYRGFPPPDGAVSVWKLHGSCNFIPTQIHVGRGVEFTRGVLFDAPPIAVEVGEAGAFCLGDSALPPQMCLYMPGKPVQISPGTVTAQQEAWRDQVASAESVVLVGVAPNAGDAHLWDALAGTKARLLYVSPDTTPFEAWSKSHRPGRPTEALASTFADAIDRLIDEITG